jgi:hypothetical protein
MSYLAYPSTARKPVDLIASSTGTNPEGWRRYWAGESERIGTNWRSVIELHLAIVSRLQASSSWCSS